MIRRAIACRASTDGERLADSERPDAEGLTNGQPWLLGRVPNGYWEHRPHRVAYMRWLGERLGFLDPDDWYALRRLHFLRNCGGGLLQTVFRDSPLEALRDFTPKRNWHPWLFSRTPNGFWADRANRRIYMQWLERKLNIERPDQWYAVTKEDFVRNAGDGMLRRHFRDSVSAAVMEYLPRRRWYPWRFASVPQGFWLKLENRIAYLDWLGKQMGYRRPSDWHSLTSEDVIRSGGASLFECVYGSRLENLFRERYPNHSWRPRAQKKASSRNRGDG